MKFLIDKQTLEDLNLLGKYKINSVYNLFSHTVTRGGNLVLERMFLNPLTNAGEINARRSIFLFFQHINPVFPLCKEEFDLSERYMGDVDNKNIIVSVFNHIKIKALQIIANNEEYALLEQGMHATIIILKKMELFMRDLDRLTQNEPYREIIKRALSILNDKNLSRIYNEDANEKFKFWKFTVYDHKLRCSLAESLTELLNIIYHMDVYINVAQIGSKRGFVYANASESNETNIDIKGVYHPCIPNAVPNDIHLDNKSNVLFLTGANMAGKSTLMKSFGVSLYLAHMGFPLAVSSMNFTVQNGMFTSINVPDDLNMGYSHFYAEVMRVKKIAVEVASGKRLVVMFDELFKGTNVKDAYDATVAIVEGFSRIHDSVFIVSTHIMEAGITLQDNCKNIVFKYLPTTMRGNIPAYTYILDNGISNDRHGMMIINNEKVIETIKGARNDN
jgi:DNA mismatch repair protein MutS